MCGLRVLARCELAQGSDLNEETNVTAHHLNRADALLLKIPGFQPVRS